MPDYHRVYVEGGLYFFTVNLLQRRGNDLLVRYIDPLRNAYPQVLLDVQLVRRNAGLFVVIPLFPFHTRYETSPRCAYVGLTSKAQ